MGVLLFSYYGRLSRLTITISVFKCWAIEGFVSFLFRSLFSRWFQRVYLSWTLPLLRTLSKYHRLTVHMIVWGVIGWCIMLLGTTAEVNAIHVNLLNIGYWRQSWRAILPLLPLVRRMIGFLLKGQMQVSVIVLSWKFIAEIHQILGKSDSLQQNVLLYICWLYVWEKLFHAFRECRQYHDLFTSRTWLWVYV